MLFINDEQMRPYYREYFGEDRPTDVIAFPMNEANLLGSIVISTDTARRQAREHHQSYWDEIRFLIIHGLLHLLGHDHAEAKEMRLMKEKEKELLTLTDSVK